MKIKTIPKIGMRNFKTALSVFIAFMLFNITGRGYPIYACLAAIISTKDTIEDSIYTAKSRIMGTIIGGFVGGLFLKLNGAFDFKFSLEILGTLGIVVVIYLCDLINENRSTTLACFMFLLILYTFRDSSEKEPMMYSINRTIDTAIGVIISLAVNKYIFPPKKIKGE